MKAFSFEEFRRIETEIPEELVEGARKGRAYLVEKLAEFDEESAGEVRGNEERPPRRTSARRRGTVSSTPC